MQIDDDFPFFKEIKETLFTEVNLENAKKELDYENYFRATQQYNTDVSEFKNRIRLRQRELWNIMSPLDFEAAVAKAFEEKGVQSRLTSYTNDGGIDIILKREGNEYFVQCKHYKSKVGVGVVREMIGAMKRYNEVKGIIVSLNGFTEGAERLAQENGIYLKEVDFIIYSLNHKNVDLLD